MEVAQGRDSFQSSGLGILPWSAHRPDLQTPRGHLPGEASAPQIPRTPGTASLNRTSSSPAEPHESPELCRLRTPPGGAPGPGVTSKLNLSLTAAGPCRKGFYMGDYSPQGGFPGGSDGKASAWV